MDVFAQADKNPKVNDVGVSSNESDGDGGISSPSNPPIEKVDRLAAEKRLLWKLDLRVVPILWVLYMFAFIDRVNIGNAKIQGLEKDLKMKGHDYNVALLVFFPAYVLFEVPSNLILRKVAPSNYLSFLIFIFGVLTVCQGVVKSYGGLVACRFLLGLFEAGFLPGVLFLMSSYYRRYELQRRFTCFFLSAIVAGAVSGLLAYAIAHMAGLRGYDGWRWIFIIEGLITVVLSIASRFLIADWPENASFLSLEEKELIALRMEDDKIEDEMEHLERRQQLRALGDWKIYLGTLIYFGFTVSGYSFNFFTPTILNQLGWTALRAQVMSIPIYCVAAVVTFFAAFASDRIQNRSSFIFAGILVATIGFAVLLAQHAGEHAVSIAGRYTALFFIQTGTYIAMPISLVWLNNNMGGNYKRAIGTAIQIGFGNAGGIVASLIFIPSQSPLYPTGYGVALGFMWASFFSALALLLLMMTANAKRCRGNGDQQHRDSRKDKANTEDEDSNFFYVY